MNIDHLTRLTQRMKKIQEEEKDLEIPIPSDFRELENLKIQI